LPAALDHQDRFLFVGRFEGRSFEPWLSGWLAARGFQSRRLGNFGTVSVQLFSTPDRAEGGILRNNPAQNREFAESGRFTK